LAGGNGLSFSMNLKFDGFAEDFRGLKEAHSAIRRASALSLDV